MKSKKMFGAVALSAALALGTAMPAFAAVGTSAPENFNSDKTATSTVEANAVTATIDATVPLTVTTVIPAGTAGGAIQAPDASAYKITNNSKTSAITLQKTVVATPMGGWSFDTTGITGQLNLTLNGANVAASTNIADNNITIVPEGEYGLTLAGTVKAKSDLDTSVGYKLVSFKYTLA